MKHARKLAYRDIELSFRGRARSTHRAAVTDHAHQELSEAIVQFLDVGEHAHGRMVLTRLVTRPCSARDRDALYGISGRSPAKHSSDVRAALYDAARLDGTQTRRAALVTLRRAICERFPSATPGDWGGVIARVREDLRRPS